MGGDIDRWGIGDLVVSPPNQLDLSMLLLGQPGVGKSTPAERITHLAGQKNRQVVAIDGKGEEDFAAGIIALNLTARPDARIGLLPATLRPLALVAGRAGRLLQGPGPSLKRPSSTPTSPSSPPAGDLGPRPSADPVGRPAGRAAVADQADPNCADLWRIRSPRLDFNCNDPHRASRQLRELARLSSGTRMLDVLIINILDELAQAVGRLERNEPLGPDKI